jgi:hypothetical protein
MVCSYNRRPSSLATANVSPGCAAGPRDSCPASIHGECLSASVVSDFVYTSTIIHISDVLKMRKQENATPIEKESTRFENASTSPVFCDVGRKGIVSSRCHLYTRSIETLCLIKREVGPRAARQAAVILRCGVSPMISVPAGAANSGRQRYELPLAS